MASYKRTACGLILFHLMYVVLCIPVSQFYPFGADAPESVQKLRDGNSQFSGPVYVVESIWFYDSVQDTVFVS